MSVGMMLPAMIVLAVPAFLVCVGITWMAYRRRGSEGSGEDGKLLQ